jgi:hypothetical protein
MKRREFIAMLKRRGCAAARGTRAATDAGDRIPDQSEAK